MSNSNFPYSLEEVDVLDGETHEMFCSKVEEWSNWLSGDDTHAIIPHLHEMIWNHAVFRIVNESRRINSHKKFVTQNGLLGEFIDQSYVSFQAISVRRLTEKGNHRPHNQIISLRRLLEDVEKNRKIITRENYLSLDGLPYDWETVRDKNLEKIRESNETIHLGSTRGNGAWDAARSKHILFDQLSGVDVESRSRADVISEDAFRRLNELMGSAVLEKLKACTNKLIAHAADEFSRSSSAEEPRYFSIKEIEDCHQILIQVANALGNEILQIEHFGTFPTAQFDIFKNFEMPWVDESGVTDLRTLWTDHAHRVDSQARQNTLVDYSKIYEY